MRSLSVLVLGSTGMLGHAVFRVLSTRADWRIDGTQSKDSSAPKYLNATHPPESWSQLICQYDYIVNCIGVLKSDLDEMSAASLRKAITVNALFPHCLAEVAGSTGSRIIHVSTDGVFSGASAVPYVETDPTDCHDAYGKTKALGECPAPNVLNIRCSLVGRDPVRHKGLIEWVLSSPDGSELTGFDDQIWTGVTTIQFATLCRRVLESGLFERLRNISSVHHFAPNSPISKYELLCLIQAASKKNIAIRREQSGLRTRALVSRFNELSSMYQGGCPWPDLIGHVIAEKSE